MEALRKAGAQRQYFGNRNVGDHMWIVFAVVLIVFLLSKIGESAEVQNLKHVEVIQTIDLYKTGYEHSGFSIGRSGTRSYYRKRKRYIGRDIKFRVTYTTGRTATVTAREGTKKCQTLFDFIDNQDRVKIQQTTYQAPSVGATKQKKKNPATETKAQLVSTLSAVAESKKESGLSVSTTKTALAKAKPAVQKKVYTAGEYKVGVTIPAGEYVLYSTNKDGSYYQVSKGQDIVFNGYAQGALLIEIQNGEYFEFDDATVQPAENIDLVGLNLPSCALKVGTHIPPGEYLLTSLSKEANPVTVYTSCRLIMDKNLKTFEYVEGQKFITLQRGDVIIYENCKIELVEEHSAEAKKTEEKAVVPSKKQYPADWYTVGEDIPQGEYVIFSEDGCKASINVTPPNAKKEKLTFSFVGSCILTLASGDKFRLSDGQATPIANVPEILDRSQAYMLKVGVHIEAGTYQLKQLDTSRFAVYYILSDSTLQFDHAIDSDAVFGAATITVSDGQYIYLENAKLI